MSSEYDKWITLRDLGIALYLLALGILSLIVPVTSWKKMSWNISSLMKRCSGKALRGLDSFHKVAALHPAYLAVDNIDIRYTQTYIESRLQLTDQNLLRKWRPVIEMTGTEHIEAALKNNKGVILWVTPTAFSDLVAKMALHRAGYPASHLSRPGHGFSRSRFGVRYLNGLRTRVENRYLKNRVRIHKGEQRGAMLALRRNLKDNGVVSITVGAQSKTKEQIPLAAGKLRIATGPIRLSELTGAPLLPVFTSNTSDQNYRVEVHESITDIGGSHQDSLQQYVVLLEEFLSNYPDQWRGIHDFDI